MKGFALTALIGAAAFAGACGSGGDGSENTGLGAPAGKGTAVGTTTSDDATRSSGSTGAETAMATARRGRVVRATDSEFGRVIADRTGEAFYLFDKEKTRKSECFGACAEVWPPVLTRGKPQAGDGAKASLLGTTRRPNGKPQVTYAGHPLYYYVDDAPGTILCHDVSEFGGLWQVVEPNGKPAA